MSENLASMMVDLFGGLTSFKFGKELIVFIISMMPILELRGGLIAAALLGLKGIPSFIICFLGNIIPIPLILWLITPIFDRMKKIEKLSRLVLNWKKKQCLRKNR